MDFLEIRRKARERAAARARSATPAASADLPGDPPVSTDLPAPAAVEVGGPSVEAEGLALTRLPDLAPPDPASREPLRPEEALPPAPRWPAMVDGGALVDALREELGAGPVPAQDDGARALPGAPTSPPQPGTTQPDPISPASGSVNERLGEEGPSPELPVSPRSAEPALAPAPADADPLAEFFFDEAEVVPALEGIPAAVAPAAGEDERRREYLTFLLGAEEYAVEIERVREVLKVPAVTEVPRAPAHVLGVVMVRGECIAVFEPRRRLGLPPAAPGRTARVLVCDAGEGPVGLLVDAVSQVVRLRPSEIEPRPQGICGAAAEYIAGIGRDRDRMLILLDLAAVVRGAPAAETVA